MFEVSIPQDYGIQESIALVTDKNAKRTESYLRIKLAFAQKMICFQDVTLDDYESVTIMQEDNRYAFPFLIVTDGLIREIFTEEKAIQWINEQEVATPTYNGYMLYYVHLPYEKTNVLSSNMDYVDDKEHSVYTEFIETEKKPKGNNCSGTFDAEDTDELPF